MRQDKHAVLRVEAQIRHAKETFRGNLCRALNLHAVSAPLMVLAGTGVNDDLNGVEHQVRFPVRFLEGREAVVVNSLAKWKRVRLGQLGFESGEGIVTDMRAIRPDEDFTPLHSIFVDQWDWERVIAPEERTLDTLRREVRGIYGALRETAAELRGLWPELNPALPDDITFVHAEELRRRYPGLSPKEREHRVCREHGAVFLIGIGAPLGDGQPHDGRAPDYDDWSSDNGEGHVGLNGDILLMNPHTGGAFEISSMGVRVDPAALRRQLAQRGEERRGELEYHRRLLAGELPQTVGGGIGQSRVCMFLLGKRHIGEVQSGLWPDGEHGGALLL